MSGVKLSKITKKSQQISQFIDPTSLTDSDGFKNPQTLLEIEGVIKTAI